VWRTFCRGSEGLVRDEGRAESGAGQITIGSCMFVPIADMRVLCRGVGSLPLGSVTKKRTCCSKKRAMRERLLLGSYRSYCLFGI
jgi:hypothetical protein